MEKKKLTIGVNASFLRKPNTGIGQVTLNFLRKLSELKVRSEKLKDKEVRFILYLEEELPKDFKLSDKFEKRILLPRIYKRDDLIRKIWWEKFMLPKQMENDDCDVFISPYQCPTTIRLHKAVKHIMVVHDIIPELIPEYLDNSRKRLYWHLTKKGIKSSDKITAVSKRTEKDMIEKLGIDGEKIAVSYIDVDDSYKRNISQKESARVLKKYKLKPGYILAGGGYEKRKNVEGVICAYASLLKKNSSEFFLPEMPKLAIYGKLLPNMPLATDAEKIIKELNLSEKIVLLGLVPQKDMPAIFENAEMFVYPSYYEGFGMPILEAMNVGTPVIAGKNSSIPEVGGDSILYCHPDDIHDIAMVMKNVLTNKNLREQLSERGKERAKNFKWERFVGKIISEILEIQKR